MSMIWQNNDVVGGISGASVAQGSATSVVDQLIDLLRQRYGIVASPSSTDNGIELRDQDGALVAIVNEQTGEIYMEAGEASRYFASVDEMVASLPPPEQKPVAEKKICEAEHFVAEEEQTTQAPALAPEQQLCQAPQQSFADADVYRPEEQQLACMSTPSSTQTDNSAKRFAEKSPASKPPPPAKEAPPPAEEPKLAWNEDVPEASVAEKPAVEKPASDAKSEAPVVVISTKMEKKAPATSPQAEVVADAGAQVFPVVSQPEAVAQISAQVFVGQCENASRLAIVFSTDAMIVESDAPRRMGEERPAGAAYVGALLFATSDPKAVAVDLSVAGASTGAKVGTLKVKRTEFAGEEFASSERRLQHDDAEKRQVRNVSDNAEASRDICSGEWLFDGGRVQKEKIGGGAVFGIFESDSARDTAQFGGPPNGSIASMLSSGTVVFENKKSRHDVVEPSRARGDSGDQDGDGQHKDRDERNEREFFVFNVDDEAVVSA